MRRSPHVLIPLVGLFFLFASCAPRLPPPGDVLDLRLLPQETGRYVPYAPGDPPLIPFTQQQDLAERFLARHFSPWDEIGEPTDHGDPFWGLKHYQGRVLYGENLLPLPGGWLEHMARQSAPDLYPLLNQPAVTVMAASLRVLPTHRPVFSNPADPGQGFPFDHLQNSLVPMGTPVLVVHVSLDKSWYLVKTAHVAGWVRHWEAAWVDQAFMDAFRSREMMGFVRDNAALSTARGLHAAHSRVGMLLPRSPVPSLEGPEDMAALLAPQRRADGWAELETVLAPAGLAEPWPLQATRDNYVRVLNGLLGQAYGWGGMFENRDCSALIQDVSALFGLVMPRNSRAQARAGRVIDLDGLSSAQKEQRILEQGVPLRTIVNLPGHVMLYLGPDPDTGRPVVLHSIWGLRIKEPRAWDRPAATPGRWVLGRTVITTLTPGEELRNLIRPEGLLVERVSSMTILGE